MTYTENNNAEKVILTCRQMNTTSESTIIMRDPGKALVPQLARIVRKGGGKIPTLAGHTCKVQCFEGYATYDIHRRRALTASGVVVWDPQAEEAAWHHAQTLGAELGLFGLLVADEELQKAEPQDVGTRPPLPWAASAMRKGALRTDTVEASSVFCIAVKTDEGLMITAPMTAATSQPCGPLARMESLLACAIYANATTKDQETLEATSALSCA